MSDGDTRLEALADGLLALVRQPVNPRGFEITRERWETKVKAKLAEVFRLGMSAGWDKAHGSIRVRVEEHRFQIEEARRALRELPGGPDPVSRESVLAGQVENLLAIVDAIAPRGE